MIPWVQKPNNPLKLTQHRKQNLGNPLQRNLKFAYLQIL